MKFRNPIFFSFLIGIMLVLGAAYFPVIDNAEKESVLMRTMLNGLNQLHYQPKKINDDFSNRVFDLYIDRIDGGKRWLTQQDVNMLDVYKNLIDDEANAGTYEFFELSIALLDKGVAETQDMYREILSEPFQFDGNETVELDGEKKKFPANKEELKENWRKSMKYEVLAKVVEKLEEQEKKGEEGEKLTMEDLEKEARESVLDTYDKWYGRIAKLKRSDRLSTYLNVITSVYDPHTSYFEPIDKQNFDIRMSGRLEGIGARLMTKEDFTEVSNIVVGGPAWKQKDLEEGDFIMKVKQEKEEEPVDIKGMVINDVVQLIRGDKGTKVTLTVKKKDGSIKDITIVRDVVITEEGFAKSLILDGKKEQERIGYIYLPRFYADFNDRNGRFCSTDVAAEVEKLKAENVDGIILDLRNNGGGSLRDVVKMSGLFIEEGPIVQVKSREREPEVLMDVDERVQYNGPLLVMVNSLSASASEILAAALQDYGRAVVVGSPTFGKGTVQRFFDLDRAIRGHSEVKPLGEVKLTTQKFYRVNGGSTQLKGVTPDIILPDNYHYIEIGEKEHDYPMAWSEIDDVEYSQKVVELKGLNNWKKASEARIAKNPTFQKVLENAKRLKEQREATAHSLNLETYRAEENQEAAAAKQYEDLFENVVNPKVNNLEVDMPSIHADESKEARNNDWIDSVQKDIYITECLNIMNDMIHNK